VDREGYGLGILSSLDYPDENVYSLMSKDIRDSYTYHSYRSQVGIQGMVYTALTRLIPRLDLYLSLRAVCCFLLVIVLMMIVKQLYQKYGLLFAATFAAITFFSPWVVDFSRNLYWVEFTWFVPMLLGLLCLNYESKRNYIYPLFFVAIFVKCLCGYEYLSTIMMSGIMFLLVEAICKPEKRKALFKAILIIGILSVLGFLTAYMIHAYMYGEGDIVGGIKAMQVDLIERRTFGDASDFAPMYADSLNASIVDVLVKYFWSAGRKYDGKLMLLIGLVTILVIICKKKLLKLDNRFDIALFVVTLFTSVSWLILAKSHSYLHTHISFVLFYMGWVQACIYIICKTLLATRGTQIKLDQEREHETVNI
jgi:hypothetical protein